MPQPAKGPNIPAALGFNLHAIADWYGQSDNDFALLCKREKSLGADRNGRLFYVCAAPVALPGSTTQWGYTGLTLPAPYPDSQTFLLHSKPGATKVIYLDFVGFTVQGTAWNSSFTGGAPIVVPAYDVDGDPSTFSSSELANIQNIWLSVAEDFAAFDVDVTTQDPGVEALRQTGAGDSYYGKRVCIGGSSMDWYGVPAGGVAYLSSFDWDTDTPAFVFPAQLGGGNPKFVAEACSHESGHTFGLHHDGAFANGSNPATEYFTGQGDWAPIMGASYYVNVTQWSKGEYQFANNQEDQIALINGYLPFRGDPFGDAFSTATALTDPSVSIGGIITQTGDADYFQFTTGEGTVSLGAAPAAPVAGDLNVLLSIYNSSGAIVASAGPTAMATGVNYSANLPAGTYYLAVNGVGSGDPFVSGYSNYGCIGQYFLSGSFVPSTNTPPVAVASNSAPLTGTTPLVVAFSSAGSTDSDGTISSYSWTFGDGVTSTSANPSHTYVAAGTYTASLIVRDNYGAASAPATVTITARANAIPTAVANATPTTGYAPQAVAFSSAGSTDPDGSINAYNWNFGDGSTSTAANPSHTYTGVGTYTATLRVTDNSGAVSSPASVIITIKANAVPTASISATPTTGVAPLAVTFSGTGSRDSDGTIASYSWNFGDGGTSTVASLSHTYTTPGTYTATLRVTDNLGALSTAASVTITVKANVAPTASASATPTSGVAPLAVTFSGTGRDTDGTIASYNWDFGDGGTAATAKPAHTYTIPGTYAATLTVTDNGGAVSAPAHVTITVKPNTPPTATASASPATGLAPLAVTFTGSGKDTDGSIASYNWDFGDGGTAATAKPSHTYTSPGTYTATLTVTDNGGAVSAPVSVTITAKPNTPPTAVASATPVTGLVPLAVTFTGTNSKDTDGSIASYSWDFGDGGTSTSSRPSHTYTAAGTYTATLTVKDNLGATSAPVSVLITVNPLPQIYVGSLTITKTSSTSGTYATVVATVTDQNGAVKANATVAGTWSGAVTGTISGKTGSAGTVSLKSSTTKVAGTITFQVTSVTLSGTTYNASLNPASSVSIAVP